MQTTTTTLLLALLTLCSPSLSIDLNVASDIAGASSLLNSGVSSVIVTPIASALLPSESTFQNPSSSLLSSALSSYANTANTQPAYLAASSFLASATPLPNPSERSSQDSSYTHALATATGNVVALPPYYAQLPSSVQTALGAYASGAKTAVSAAKATPSVLVFNASGNSTLAGTNGTLAGVSNSASGSGRGTAPAGTGTGMSTVTSTSFTAPNANPTSTGSSSASSSASSSSSKGGAAAVSQPTGAAYKIAGVAAVGMVGVMGLL